MKKELSYFYIGDSFGGNQNWFSDPMMRLGGCAAETACEFAIFMAKNSGNAELCPLDVNHLTKESYIEFSKTMKPYLKPRFGGITRLSIYVDGLKGYLRSRNSDEFAIHGYSGNENLANAEKQVRDRIDAGFPVPFLLLRHKSPAMKFLTWHWFMLGGYETYKDELFVKVITYGSYHWISLKELWNTGHREKGGMILISGK